MTNLLEMEIHLKKITQIIKLRLKKYGEIGIMKDL